ncbi:hypothetical protein P7C70_g2494, partial [Phenoliferia sp. Uapishka_3]
MSLAAPPDVARRNSFQKDVLFFCQHSEVPGITSRGYYFGISREFPLFASPSSDSDLTMSEFDYSGAGSTTDPYIVHELPSLDPANPKAWSKSWKWTLSIINAFAMMSGLFSISAYTSGFAGMIEEFDTTLEVLAVGETLFLVGLVPIIYQEERHWSQGSAGLPYLALVVGYFVSVLPIALFWMGWTAHPTVQFMNPVIAGGIFGFSQIGIMMSVYVYLTDLYTVNVGAVFSGMNFLRFGASSFFPLFTQQLYTRLGVAWACSLIAFILTVFMPIPFIFFAYGPAIRARSNLMTVKLAVPIDLEKDQDCSGSVAPAHMSLQRPVRASSGSPSRASFDATGPQHDPLDIDGGRVGQDGVTKQPWSVFFVEGPPTTIVQAIPPFQTSIEDEDANAEPARRNVTLSELRAGNTPTKAWVAVRGQVYDLTQFARRHPGGSSIIYMAAGRDITPLFETSHGARETALLAKFLVGNLAGKDVPSYPVPDRFAQVLKATFFFATRLILPFFLGSEVSPGKVLGVFVLSDFVVRFTFAIIAQASHVVDSVEWPMIDPVTGNIEHDFMRLQIETSQDYSHGSALTTLLVGALNLQAVHHAFPNIAQPYYEEITPIIVATAKEFGVKYTIKGTLWEAVGGHIGLLKMMGEPPHEL